MPEAEPEPAIHYEIDRANHLIRTTFVGAVSMEQISAYMKQLEKDPDYDLSFDALVDLRTYTGQLEPDLLRQLALQIRENPGSPGARRAVLVANDLQTSLMRLLQAFTSLAPVVYRTFRSADAAMAWLAERKR